MLQKCVLSLSIIHIFISVSVFPVRGAELVVSAAASLADVFPDLGEAYEDEHPEKRIIFNFASSGACYRQLEQGAPAEVFASANKLFMDRAVEDGLVAERTRRVFAGNRLILAVPAGNPARIGGIDDLLQPRVTRIALGNPETVPAGQYARKGLQVKGLWDILRDKFIYAGHVRSVLAYLKRGNVDAGFIYRTDARKGGADTEVVCELQEAPRVYYWVAVTEGASESGPGLSFLNFLKSGKARNILRDYGFSVKGLGR